MACHGLLPAVLPAAHPKASHVDASAVLTVFAPTGSASSQGSEDDVDMEAGARPATPGEAGAAVTAVGPGSTPQRWLVHTPFKSVLQTLTQGIGAKGGQLCLCPSNLLQVGDARPSWPQISCRRLSSTTTPAVYHWYHRLLCCSVRLRLKA